MYLKTIFTDMGSHVSRIFSLIRELPLRAYVALLAATPLSAAANGVSGLFRGWGSAATETLRLIVLIGMVGGVAACLYGIFKLVKKGSDRGEDIEWRQIAWPIIGGALATVLLFVITLVIEESGGSRSDMGRNF